MVDTHAHYSHFKEWFFVAASDAETKEVWVGSQRELYWGR